MEEQDLQGHHPGIGEFQPSEGVYTYDPSAERVTEEGAALHQLFWYACAYDPSAERITEEGAAFFQQGEIPSAYVESEERITEEGSPRYLRTTDGLQSAHMSPLERKTDDLHKPRKVRTTEGSRPSRRQRVHKNTHSLASLRDRHIALKKRKAREQRALKTLRSERRRKIFHPSVNIQPEMQIAGLSIDNSPPIESTTADPAVGSNPSVIDSLVYAFGDETALWETITTYPAKVRVQTIDILGKLKRSSVLPTLICALRDEHWEVRAAAAQALGEAGNPIVIEALIRTLCDETDVIAKQAMVRALGKQRDMQSRSTLTFLLRRDEDCLVREAAAWALGLFQEKAPVQHLAYALAHDSDELVRTAAARALGMTGATGAKAARPALKDAFKNERDTSVQTAIMEALQRLEDEQGTSFSHDVL